MTIFAYFKMEEPILEPRRKRNPLVIVGALTTAGVLVGGFVAFKRGNTNLSQQMMRARVIAQGATIAIMLGSSGFFAMRKGLDAEGGH